MAQLLVRLKDNVCSDPTKDARSSFKKGHPVSVKPDGWYEGNSNWTQSAYADKTKWVVINLPNMTVDELQQYIVPLTNAVTGNRIYKRRYVVSPAVIDQIALQGGYVTVTNVQFAAAIIDRNVT